MKNIIFVLMCVTVVLSLFHSGAKKECECELESEELEF